MSYFKTKMHQIRFRLGLCPDPARGDYSVRPDTLVGFKGPTSKGKRGVEKGGKGKGEEGRKGKGRMEGTGEGEGGEGEWGSPTHYFRLKSCTAWTWRNATVVVCRAFLNQMLSSSSLRACIINRLARQWVTVDADLIVPILYTDFDVTQRPPSPATVCGLLRMRDR